MDLTMTFIISTPSLTCIHCIQPVSLSLVRLVNRRRVVPRLNDQAVSALADSSSFRFQNRVLRLNHGTYQPGNTAAAFNIGKRTQ